MSYLEEIEMNRNELAERLQTASDRTIALARPLVSQPLSDRILYLLQPNANAVLDSSDLFDDEETFPQDTRHDKTFLGPLTENETLDFLLRNGKTPEWIDLAVHSEDGQHTHIRLLISGIFTANEHLLYHREEGYPPFHATPPAPPDGWTSLEQDGPFDLYWRARPKMNKEEPK